MINCSWIFLASAAFQPCLFSKLETYASASSPMRAFAAALPGLGPGGADNRIAGGLATADILMSKQESRDVSSPVPAQQGALTRVQQHLAVVEPVVAVCVGDRRSGKPSGRDLFNGAAVRDPNRLSIPFDDVGLQLDLGLFSGAARYPNQFEDRPCKRRPLRHATDA